MAQQQAPIVPYSSQSGGAAPTVTPPQGSFTQGDQPTIGAVPGGDTDQLKQMLLKVLTQASQQRQLPTPVPAPLPQANQPGQVGTGPSWGFERFANNLSSHIQQGVQNFKAKQLAEAESDWNQLASAIQSNNPQALNFILTDQKKLKNMAKALNQDWLNPEKTTVYKQALDNVIKQQQAKGQAAQGLKGLFQKLIHKANNPQLTDEQKQAIAKEIMGRAPLTSAQADSKEIIPLITEEMKEEEAQRKQQETEQYNTFRDEQKQRFQAWTDTNNRQFQEHMQNLKDLSAERRQSDHDLMMMQALGIRLSDEDKRRMQITPAQMNTEINSTLTSLRSQANQASEQLRSLQTQAQKRSSSLWQRMISDSPDVAGAQSKVDNLNSAISFIEKNRAGIISGKVGLDSVVDQAQSIVNGTPPGFK